MVDRGDEGGNRRSLSEGGKKGESVVLDTHHFSSKRRWQLLCVIVRGEEKGGGRRGVTGKREERREWGRRGCHESIGEEKHPLAIMEKKLKGVGSRYMCVLETAKGGGLSDLYRDHLFHQREKQNHRLSMSANKSRGSRGFHRS